MPTKAVVQVHLSLDRIREGEMPVFHASSVANTPMLYAMFGETTIWLRVDQVNELASKLLAHLPSTEPKEAA